MSESILSFSVREAIRTDPEAAAREIPKIMDFYVLDNGLLNAVYTAAKRVLVQPDKFGLDLLKKAVANAEVHHVRT